MSGRLNPALVRVIAGQICIHACMAGTRLAVPLLALRQGHSAATVGMLLARFALTQVFLSLPAGRYADSARHLTRRAHWLSGNRAALLDDFGAAIAEVQADNDAAAAAQLAEELDDKFLFPGQAETTAPRRHCFAGAAQTIEERGHTASVRQLLRKAPVFENQRRAPHVRVFPTLLAVFVVVQIPTFFLYRALAWRAFAEAFAGR